MDEILPQQQLRGIRHLDATLPAMRRSTDPESAAELAAHGLRATRQRVVLLRALRAAGGHPTAAELHEIVSSELPAISLKTVYQALESFVDADLADLVTEAGEPYRYESRTERHYHARCRACRRLYDVPARCDRQISGRTPLPRGFKLERIAVTLVGLCPRCAVGSR